VAAGISISNKEELNTQKQIVDSTNSKNAITLEKNITEIKNSVEIKNIVDIKNNIDTNNHAVTYTAPIIKKQQSKDKFFYTGLLYAIDKSSIGFEPSKGKGHSLAFLLGYHFNKVFSFESGIHIEKKEYYTTGENFDKSIFQSTGKIHWIESENDLIEIPLSLKVDFLNRKKHALFGSVGFSSYLVNNQYFEYEEEVNGIIQNESLVFTNNTSNLFASLNFSLGYELKIKKLGKLRIEPYLNLPLSGIGKVREPVLSKGIYFGWIYEFHNTKLKQ
jgi:hypothetical protein